MPLSRLDFDVFLSIRCASLLFDCFGVVTVLHFIVGDSVDL